MSITLAIESAIAGGSISLLDGSDEIANWIGSSEVSKAEDLLINIDSLLNQSNLTRKDIDQIAVSAGPGSFTGIRIGLATALGLKNGLGLPLATIPALEAIALGSTECKLHIAVPMGRSTVCIQQFEDSKATDEPCLLDYDQFVEMVRRDAQSKYIVHKHLYSDDLDLTHVIAVCTNIAKAVGLFAIRAPNVTTRPLFMSKTSR